MARIYPDDIFHGPLCGMPAGLQRELDILQRLRDTLPDAYSLFHSVEWRSVYQGRDAEGEVDIVAMNQAGDLLLLEIKAGPIEEAADGLYKQYGAHRKNIGRQCRRQHAALLARIRELDRPPRIGHVLLLPDYRMLGAGSAAYPRERIIDAADFPDLAARLCAVLPQGEPSGNSARVRAFLLNWFQVAPALDVLRDQLSNVTQRLGSGLAAWATRVDAPSRVLRIQATAGSGKTQLALRLLHDAADQGQRALYACFNRSLSEQIGRLAPPRATVSTFHELAVDHFRRARGALDFSAPDALRQAAQRYCEDSASFEPQHDVLIIDEGQDFDPHWTVALRRLLREEGRFYFLEDEDQRLYEHPPCDIPEAVVLHCPDNFRSPTSIVDSINVLRLTPRPIRALGAYAGREPAMSAYDDEDQMLLRTAQAVRGYLDEGYAPGDIVILSYRGLARSHLLGQAELCGHGLRRFAGYDGAGASLWTEGAILADTLFRYKGQSCPVVVLTEVSFAELGERERRRLFVGLTRARMAATVVMDRQAEAALGRALQD